MMTQEEKRKYNKRWHEAHREELKEYYRKYRADHLEQVKEYYRKYRADHPEQVKESQRKWKKANPQYQSKRLQTDIQFKLASNLRARLNIALKNGSKGGSAVRDLGCSVEEFKVYIESQWKPGMTWENWKHNGWHLDHIIPLVTFDLTDRQQVLAACHYTNYQPIWAKDNLSKRDNCHTYDKFFMDT